MKKSKKIFTVQEQTNKASAEIGVILKKYGLTFRVTHSVELVPNIPQGGRK